MASHGDHHSAYTLSGMPAEEIAMQQQPMHYTQQAQQPDQMLMGGEGYGMPAPQLHAQMQSQFRFQAQMQPQFQEQRRVAQLQAQKQPQLQEPIQPQLPAQMNLQQVQRQVFLGQQPDQMLMGGGGHGMPAPQPHAQMQSQLQFQAQMQPQFQEQRTVPQLQAQIQPELQEPIQPQLPAQMNLQQVQVHHQQVQVQVQQQDFWEQQHQEVHKFNDFKHHSLPLARIKKIMKSDSPGIMVALEAQVFFAKACELFILDLTQRALGHTLQNKRRTLQTSHITSATCDADIFDFLQDIVPRGSAAQV